MIVLDASVAVQALISDGPARDIVGEETSVVPHLIDAEVLNALRRRVRAGSLAPSDAFQALAVWEELGLTRHTMQGLLGRAWEIRENVSAYDAIYVALAEGLDIPLVTADSRLARAPGIQCAVTVVPID